MSADDSLEIPSEIAASRLYTAGGFTVIRELFAAEVVAELQAEALAARPTGQRNVAASSDGTEGRGGSPGRAFYTVPGGALQWQLFSASALVESLVKISGLALEPLGGGSFTFYDQPGDFLALHRDIVACDLAVITCLDRAETRPGGGGLIVYPDHATKPLSAARWAGRAAGTPAPLARGETILLLGGVVPHEVTPMETGQERIVSVMCCRVLL